ncbi:MAG: hypothetical protein WC680_03505 [Sulfuricurvum sp.]|jgi:hypothetical protein
MDLTELTNSINIFTMMSYGDRQKLLKWVARQNDLIILEIFKLKKNHFHRLKANENINDIVLLDAMSFFLAVKELIEQSKMINRKNRSGNFGFLRKVGQIRAKQLRKPRKNIKNEKLLNLQQIVVDLIEVEKYSYRDVSSFMIKVHRFSVSHVKIGTFYKTIKKGKKNDYPNI